MSHIARMAAVLEKYVYTPEYGCGDLTGTANGGCPCLGCLGKMHADVVNLRCVCGDHSEKCVPCEEEKKKCAAVPRELWGAAQATWDFFNDFKTWEKDDDLSPLERFRIHRALSDCSAAWKRIAELIRDPTTSAGKPNMEQLQLQELSSIREHLSLDILVRTGIITEKREVVRRLDAASPAYIRNDAPAERLRDLIKRLADGPHRHPVPELANEGALGEFPSFGDELLQRLADCSANDVPACGVAIAGARPIGRGLGTRTPKKRPAAEMDGDEDDQEAQPSPGAENSPSVGRGGRGRGRGGTRRNGRRGGRARGTA
ncbi:hypothetical protein K4K57_004277 [Colletotrichum sp. SAR 10_99]|nr:hypothetical protein K4K57_004277 [Colletotrichum sp. SAR 10_99]